MGELSFDGMIFGWMQAGNSVQSVRRTAGPQVRGGGPVGSGGACGWVVCRRVEGGGGSASCSASKVDVTYQVHGLGSAEDLFDALAFFFGGADRVAGMAGGALGDRRVPAGACSGSHAE